MRLPVTKRRKEQCCYEDRDEAGDSVLMQRGSHHKCRNQEGSDGQAYGGSRPHSIERAWTIEKTDEAAAASSVVESPCGTPSKRTSIANLAIEELFTNMVKYGKSGGNVTVEITGIPGGIEVTLIEEDAEPFDPTKGAEVDITAPIEQRRPVGLGLHLIRRLVDSIDYRYAAGSRQARTTFQKMLPDAQEKGGS